MSTSSSDEGSGPSGNYAISSGLESTGSLLSSVPSDSSDVQTEITPPSSPTPCEAKVRTSRDILHSFRRLGQISGSTLQGDVMPTKPRYPKQFHRRAPLGSETSDEAGYDADGDGDEGIPGADGAGTTATTRPTRRPTFLRIDTRQHRRVASMLASSTRRPSSSFGDTYGIAADTPNPPRAKLSLFPNPPPSAATPAKPECYELRRPRAAKETQPVGLGIGFPESHPLRHRAFSMPVSAVSPSKENPGSGPRWQCEWWSPSPSSFLPAAAEKQCKQKTARVDSERAPSGVRFALRPTYLGVSPSPIECLSGTFDRVLGDHGTRSEVPNVEGNRGTVGTFGCDAEPEREMVRLRYDGALLVAREGQLDLSKESMVPGAGSKVRVTLDVGSRSATSLTTLGAL